MNNLATIARIRQSLASRGVIKGNEVATQGYLRLAYDLNQSLSSFTFNVLENQGTQIAGEKRLLLLTGECILVVYLLLLQLLLLLLLQLNLA